MFVVNDISQFRGRLVESTSIGTVDYPNQDVRVWHIVTPVRADVFLTTDIPHIQFEPIVLKLFDVETLCCHDALNVSFFGATV